MFCPDCGGRKMIKKRAEVYLLPACLVNYKAATHPESGQKKWWPDPESNWGHGDFQSPALPTELSCHSLLYIIYTIFSIFQAD